MLVQVKSDSGRIATAATDLDVTAATVRPLVAFQLTREGVYVVFVHLKSASKSQATEAVATAAAKLKVVLGDKVTYPVLWIGDFNRAEVDAWGGFANPKELLSGGGQAKWDLDRAIISGKWPKDVSAEVVSKSSDSEHIAISVTIG